MGALDVRRHIIELVRLIASKEQQLAYERDVPIADVPSELVCMWVDDLYHPDSDLFFEAFNSRERDRLAKFHTFFDARVHQLPDSLPEMQKNPAWIEVMREAQRVLDDLDWTAGR